MTSNMDHMNFLDEVVAKDLKRLREKELGTDKKPGYQGSWKKRGGIGAFHMVARKWDRIEAQVERTDMAEQHDIFGHVAIGGHPDGTLDDIRDLRCYLLLIEAELMAQGTVQRLEGDDRSDPGLL